MRVFTATACDVHDPGPGHPDQPARLAAVLSALKSLPGIVVTTAQAAPIDALLRVHDAAYLDRAMALSAGGGGELGPDTMLSPGSWTAAVAATGAGLAALGHALNGAGHAFAAIRPPGHHALRNRAMGFCIINHVAVLAAAARMQGRERVLIVDWDVHHGNGTQALVQREVDTHFVSMHQWPWYPGTGAADERGVGNCFNIPMRAGQAPEVYVESLWRGIERATTDWSPDVILISAGYDAMRGDPLGGFTLEPEHYALWITRLRERFIDVPIVALLEGGYAPARLAAGVVATVEALAA
jgi:acetoin utilization deacetylase AcuC-like enzyme